MPISSLGGEQFAAAMQHSPIGMALVALDGTWLWTNGSLGAMLGFDATDFAKSSLHAITHPEDRGTDPEQIRSLLAGEPAAYQVEKRYIRKDGSFIWCLLAVSLVQSAQGEPPYFICTIQDISQRKADDVERAAQTERLALAVRAGGVGVFEWDLATDALIWNDQMFTLFGIDRTATEPRFEWFLTTVLEDRRERLEHELAEAIAGRRAFDTEFAIQTPSGETRHIRALSTVLCDRDGNAARMIGTNWDVTAEKQLSAVQHERRRFGAAIEAVQGVLWTNDATGRMVGEQPGWAKLTGQRLADYQDYGWAAAVHPDDAQPTVDAWNLAVAERRTFIFEHRVRRHDGAWCLFSIRAVPMLDANGDILEWVGVHTDITQQRQAEAEIKNMNADLERRVDARTSELHSMARHLEHARTVAEEANRAKTRFLAGMSHELRTPLNGILGYAQLLSLEGGLNATQQARVDAMLGAGKHLLGMITSVLDMAEIEVGHLNLQIEEFDPAGVAKECLAVVAAIAAEKRLSLNLSTGPGAPAKIWSDATRVRQVLLNLIGNALKFTREGGVELRLLSAGTGRGLRIEVADTGPGIRADLRHRLFADFDRLNERGNSRIEGNGLGLAFSARLVSLMGGRIGYDDQPGGGSLFWFELPMTVGEVSSAPAASPTTLPSSAVTARSLHVLVTDDVAINREIASAFVRRAGHQVTCVASGAEAVAAVANQAFDVILMDVSMPEMDGMEATRHIRALPGSNGQCPIIALTAHAFSDQITDCLAAGMTAHLSKPVTQEALTEAIARALALGSGNRRSPNPRRYQSNNLRQLDADSNLIQNG